MLTKYDEFLCHQIEREVSFFDEEACELRCGDDIGYGIIEQVISGKYPKYGFEGD
jgi:hypothetical protein